jgi:hypothetical protein
MTLNFKNYVADSAIGDFCPPRQANLAVLLATWRLWLAAVTSMSLFHGLVKSAFLNLSLPIRWNGHIYQ